MVAWSQREIAANKYRMDLFDKRSPAIKELSTNISNLTDDKSKFRDMPGIYSTNVDAAVFCINSTADLFKSISLSKFKELHLQFQKYPEKINLLEKTGREITRQINSEGHFLDQLLRSNNTCPDPREKQREDIDAAITFTWSEYEDSYIEIRNYLLDIEKQMRNLWHIPHSPYQETLIDKIINFFSNFTTKTRLPK